MLRLDKFLADMNTGTRSELKKAIRAGRVKVNDLVVKKPEEKVDPEKDTVTYDGQVVRYSEYEYWMLHKPAGVVSATQDKKQSTVLDLLPEGARKDLFPVGRLDKDTEGLLLITNDGDLTHRLLAPGKHVDKCYYAKIDGRVTEEDVQKFAEGMDIGDEKLTMPSRLKILRSDMISEIQITIQEGRFHQIKRMFEAVDKEVVYLKRLSMGSLVLDESLPIGEARKLTDKELEELCKNR